MIAFVLGATLIALLALAVLLLPLLRRASASGALTQRQLNADIYRDQLAELDRDRKEGMLDEADHRQAVEELQRRLIEDSGEPEAVPGAAKGRSLATAAVLGLSLPVLSVLLYLQIGNPAGIDPPKSAPEPTAEDIDRMVESLAARLEKEPENFQGWIMLARSYKALGRFPEAEKAFGRAMKWVEADAQLLSDYAEVVALNADGNLRGAPSKLIDKALKLDPKNPQALVLAGTAAYQRGDYRQAVAHWERLLEQLPADSEDARSLADSIAKARAAGKAR